MGLPLAIADKPTIQKKAISWFIMRRPFIYPAFSAYCMPSLVFTIGVMFTAVGLTYTMGDCCVETSKTYA